MSKSLLLSVFLIISILFANGCGIAKPAETVTTTLTETAPSKTITITLTTTTTTTMTTEPTTPTTIRPTVAPPLTSMDHDTYIRIGECNTCHDPAFSGGGFSFFYPDKGPNDHTGRTDDTCVTQEGCHVLG